MAVGGGGLTEKWGGRVPAKGRREGIMTVKGAGLAGLMRFGSFLSCVFCSTNTDFHSILSMPLYAKLTVG